MSILSSMRDRRERGLWAHTKTTEDRVRLGLLTEPPSADAVGRPRRTLRSDRSGLLTRATGCRGQETTTNTRRRASRCGIWQYVKLWFLCCLVVGLASCRRAEKLGREAGVVGQPIVRQLPLDLVEDLNNDGVASPEAGADGNFDRPDQPEGVGGHTYPGDLMPQAGERLRCEAGAGVAFVMLGCQSGVPNNFTLEGQGFKLPRGHYSAAFVLGASDRVGERVVATFYYEGKRQEVEYGVSSWLAETPQEGEKVGLSMPCRYRVEPGGVQRIDEGCDLWVRRFDLDSARKLKSVRFNSYNTHVHVFAITLLCNDWSPEHAEYLEETERSYGRLREPVHEVFKGYESQVESLRKQLAALPAGIRQRFKRQLQWVRTRIEFAESALPDDRVQLCAEEAELIEEAISEATRDIQSLRKGEDPFAAKRGIVLKSYHSALDDTLQPYWLFVPQGYTGAEAWPLVVNLHGHGWYRPFQGYPEDEHLLSEAIVLRPHGRGSIDYMLQSEADVLNCIEDVKRDYNVDRDRVCLTGRSMGATGTWNLGVKFPDLFAGLAPVAGNSDSRVWERLWKWASPDDSPAIGKVKGAVAYSANPVEYAENLMNLPVFCVHGSDDRVVPVDHSRSMVQRVWQLPDRYYFEYREPQRTSHSAVSEELLDEQTTWLLGQRRVTCPRRVCLKTMKLRYGEAHWIKLEALSEPLKYAQVTAEASESGEIDIEAEQVAAMTLDIVASPAREAASLRVCVNGACAYEGDRPTGGKLTLVKSSDGSWQSGDLPDDTAKRAELEGPIEDALLSPFVLVYGTGGSSPFDKAVAKAEAERLATDWERLFTKPCRVKADTEVTDDDIEELNLVLYGGPDSNALTERVMATGLPIRIGDGRVEVGAKVFEGADVGVKFCYPNPLNKKRYVVVFAGTTWQGLFQIVNRFGNWFHWGPFDNRNWFDYGVFDDRTKSPETFLCFGFFDWEWRLDPKYQWLGYEKVRKVARPRRVPRYSSVSELPDSPRDGTGSTRKRLYLSDLVPTLIDQHKGVVSADMSFQGNMLGVGQTPHARGLGVRAPSEVTFAIDGRFARFEAAVGVDLEGAAELTPVRKKMEWIQFEVYGDDRRLYRSDWLQGDSPPCQVSVPVAGVQELRLRVNGSWARWLLGSAAWGSARVVGEGR